MKKTRLLLRRERIQELSTRGLAGVVGGSETIDPTYSCGCPTQNKEQTCGPSCVSTAGRLGHNFPC